MTLIIKFNESLLTTLEYYRVVSKLQERGYAEKQNKSIEIDLIDSTGTAEATIWGVAVSHTTGIRVGNDVQLIGATEFNGDVWVGMNITTRQTMNINFAMRVIRTNSCFNRKQN